MLVLLCFALQCLLLSPVAEAQINLCKADQKEQWSYRGENGPKYWGDTFPQCKGKQQTPIDIKTSDVIEDENLAKLDLKNYGQPITSATVENNGHTIQVTPDDGVSRSISVDGSTYTLRQFHFHWGYVRYQGSEHTINGQQFAMEMHLVHMNENEEIAVVGIIFTEESSGNQELKKVVDTFSEVKYKDSKTKLASEVNLNKMVPENPASYYNYQGSLTTPACGEGVKWFVLTKMMPVSTKEMFKFRMLSSARKEDASIFCGLSGNYRPIQPLNGREVYLSQ